MTRSRPTPTRAWLTSPAAENLRSWLGWITERHAALGGRTEIRIIGHGERRGVWSAFIGPADVHALAEDLAPVSPEPRARIPSGDHPRSGEANIYFGLNPVRPDLADHCGLRRVKRTTRDTDVMAYTMLAIDVDPERRPRSRSASDAEKAAAGEVADVISAWLRSIGVEPLMADSGNGVHLLVPLVPSTDDELPLAARDAHRLLKALDERFSTAGAKVDTTTANPSRILKLYGTLAVKGESSAEHPHRVSSIDLESIPEDVDLFARLAVDGLAFPDLPDDAAPPSTPPDAWSAWRSEAVDALPLDRVYGDLLTGRRSGESWLECRDPSSPSGDQRPSAGVADGSGEAERGAFHSFRSGETWSVFDVLVRWGRAEDFSAACRLVAELSGIPTPNGPPRPRDPMETFAATWARAHTDAERGVALRQVAKALLSRSAVERRAGLDRVQELTELPASVVREAVTAARKEIKADKRRASAEPATDGNKTVVDFVENRDTIDALFAALVDAVAPTHRFFRHEQDLVFVEPGTGPVTITDRNIAGLLSSVAEIRFLRESEEGQTFLRYDVLPGDLGRAFVASPEVRTRLPRLHQYTRSPLFDHDWRFIGMPGFHAESGTYYDGPLVEPLDTFTHLDAALRDFHWKAEADRSNFVGALLTALTMPHWGRGHPFLAINGNKPGVGKSTLARVLGVVVEGAVPSSVSFTPDDAEFEKQLATRVEAGDRVLVIDNVKTRRTIESAVLERCITDARLNFRRLGSNTAITRSQNDLLVCLTMNLTQMGQDLRRRALPINLELNENVRSVRYGIDDLIGLVLRSRLAILGELAGMVLAWVQAGKPECDEPARHSTSQSWAATIDAILRTSAYDGFLTNFEASEHAYDPRYQVMLEVAQLHHAKPPATSAEWVERLKDGPLEDRFRDRRGNPKSARACSTIVGSLFTEYLDARFSVDGKAYELARAYPNGPTRSPTYAFKQVPS